MTQATQLPASAANDQTITPPTDGQARAMPDDGIDNLEPVLLAGGAALILFGAGLIMAHPGLRRMARTAVTGFLPDLDKPLRGGIDALIPDLERYLKIRSM